MERMIGLLFFITLISGCATTSISSITNQVPRTIVLDGERYTENKIGDFITWGCSGYGQPNNILVEVGIFSVPELSESGFILFDGGDAGELAFYQRDGINHRWSWGSNRNDYVFIINPHGGGSYYDFSNVPNGESTMVEDLFSCKRM